MSVRLPAVVDKLGALNAKIAELSAEANKLKASLLLAGMPEVVGSKYKAVIVVAPVESVDMKAVKAFYASINKNVPKKSALRSSVSLYDL